MKEKIDILNKYMDDPKSMVVDDFSLFVAIEEILHIRAGTENRTFDRNIYEVFHRVFSFYLEPVGGSTLLVDGDSFVQFGADIDANLRIIDAKKQMEFNAIIEKARSENITLKNEIHIRTAWDIIRPKLNSKICTKEYRTWTKDEPYLMMGIINRNEPSKSAEWNSFYQYINRDKTEIKKSRGDMILKRICDLYLDCNFPFTDTVTYSQNQSSEPTVCELNAEATKALYDICVKEEVFKKCDIQTFANGFNCFDDCQHLEIKNKNLFCIIWYFWDQFFDHNNKKKAEAWLHSFGENMPEYVRKRGFYDISKDFPKKTSKPQQNLYEDLSHILL